MSVGWGLLSAMRTEVGATESLMMFPHDTLVACSY